MTPLPPVAGTWRRSALVTHFSTATIMTTVFALAASRVKALATGAPAKTLTT
jgi:hypothetical protein